MYDDEKEEVLDADVEEEEEEGEDALEEESF